MAKFISNTPNSVPYCGHPGNLISKKTKFFNEIQRVCSANVGAMDREDENQLWNMAVKVQKAKRISPQLKYEVNKVVNEIKKKYR